MLYLAIAYALGALTVILWAWHKAKKAAKGSSPSSYKSKFKPMIIQSRPKHNW